MIVALASSPAARAETVWQWFAPCPPTEVATVTARFRGSIVYSAEVPACPLPREAIPAEEPQRVLAFGFRGRADRFGPELRALGVREIRGNIWRAGGESWGMLFGVSFESEKRILVNTLVVADARHGGRSEVANGLVVSVSPVHRR